MDSEAQEEFSAQKDGLSHSSRNMIHAVNQMNAMHTANTEKGRFVVLLATQDRQLAGELRMAFQNTGIDLLVSEDATDLFSTMAERQINLTIFDPDLVELRGEQVLFVLKKFRPKARVIVLSEDSSFETRETLARSGVLYQMQKPIDSMQISEVVKGIVQKLHQHASPFE